MSRRKSDKVDDFAIGLMERHSHVPTGDEQLERYARMYLGRVVGYEHAVEVQQEVAPVEAFDAQPGQPYDVPADVDIDAEVAAATSYDDIDNDYDRPGATVVFDALDAPAGEPEWGSIPEDAVEPAPEPADVSMDATMTFDAAELGDAPQVDYDPEGENSTVMLDALEDQDDDGEGETQTAEGGDTAGDGGRRRKKRRHR